MLMMKSEIKDNFFFKCIVKSNDTMSEILECVKNNVGSDGET